MSSESSYQLSCIVPIYNVEEYLEACLESLLKVSAVRMEIILVDDGSTDLSGKIADRYATQRPFIKVIHQYNQGLAVARNHGLEAASGNYIVFIDSDDWVNPEQFFAPNLPQASPLDSRSPFPLLVMFPYSPQKIEKLSFLADIGRGNRCSEGNSKRNNSDSFS